MVPILAVFGSVLVVSIDVYSFFLGNDLFGVVMNIRVLLGSDLAGKIDVCYW